MLHTIVCNTPQPVIVKEHLQDHKMLHKCIYDRVIYNTDKRKDRKMCKLTLGDNRHGSKTLLLPGGEKRWRAGGSDSVVCRHLA